MAITIDSAFIEEYEDNVRHLAQQSDVRLRPHTYEVNSGGEAYNFERLGPSEAEEKIGRRQDTSYIDDDWSRRVATPRTFNHTMTIEHEDKVQMLVDPESTYAQSQGNAMRRAYDRIIIEACTGAALYGDGTSEDLATAAPDQIIGDGTTPISFDMLTAAQEQYMKNEIMPDEAKIIAVGPTQVRKLMQLTEQTSADYVQAQALQRYGIVPNWLGFTWIVSNLLEADTPGDDLYCVSFTRRGIGLAVNQDTFTRIGENPEKQYMIQVFSQWTAGAFRTEDEHFVVLHVADTL